MREGHRTVPGTAGRRFVRVLPAAVIGIASLLAAIASTAAPARAATPKVSPAERAAISKVYDPFVMHAVARKNPLAAWDLVARSLQTSRSDWRKGNLPVYPYDAYGTHFPWTVAAVAPDHVWFDSLLHTKDTSKVGPIGVRVEMQRIGGAWKVVSFLPVKVFPPTGSGSKSGGGGGGGSSGAEAGANLPNYANHGPEGTGTLLILVIAIGALFLAPALIFGGRARRDRRQARRIAPQKPKGLPPLPPRHQQTGSAGGRSDESAGRS
jgi:hypothetical protein